MCLCVPKKTCSLPPVLTNCVWACAHFRALPKVKFCFSLFTFIFHFFIYRSTINRKDVIISFCVQHGQGNLCPIAGQPGRLDGSIQGQPSQAEDCNRNIESQVGARHSERGTTLVSKPKPRPTPIVVKKEVKQPQQQLTPAPRARYQVGVVSKPTPKPKPQKRSRSPSPSRPSAAADTFARPRKRSNTNATGAAPVAIPPPISSSSTWRQAELPLSLIAAARLPPALAPTPIQSPRAAKPKPPKVAKPKVKAEPVVLTPEEKAELDAQFQRAALARELEVNRLEQEKQDYNAVRPHGRTAYLPGAETLAPGNSGSASMALARIGSGTSYPSNAGSSISLAAAGRREASREAKLRGHKGPGYASGSSSGSGSSRKSAARPINPALPARVRKNFSGPITDIERREQKVIGGDWKDIKARLKLQKPEELFGGPGRYILSIQSKKRSGAKQALGVGRKKDEWWRNGPELLARWMAMNPGYSREQAINSLYTFAVNPSQEWFVSFCSLLYCSNPLLCPILTKGGNTARCTCVPMAKLICCFRWA